MILAKNYLDKHPLSQFTDLKGFVVLENIKFCLKNDFTENCKNDVNTIYNKNKGLITGVVIEKSIVSSYTKGINNNTKNRIFVKKD